MSGKLLIVLFAVFLVSVHAFVKRDTATPAGDTNSLDNLTKQIQDFSKNINSQLSESLKPEAIQKGVNDAIENLQKMLNDFKEKTNAPAAKS